MRTTLRLPNGLPGLVMAIHTFGALHLEVWNPHTGDIGPAEQAATDAGGAPRTRVRLKLGANRSLFIVGTTPPLTGTRQR